MRFIYIPLLPYVQTYADTQPLHLYAITLQLPSSL